MNILGRELRLSIFGESHGEGIGITIDGVPGGVELSEQLFEADLERRRAVGGATTARQECDSAHILSGVYRGYTTGAPLTLWFENREQHSSDYDRVKCHFRPSHADFTAHSKFGGFNDPRGGGHFSGRLTVALVAAGVVAKTLLGSVEFSTRLIRVGGCDDELKFEQILDKVKRDGDSVGGVVECRVKGLPVGVGEPFFDSVESVVSHSLFSVPGVKGVEFGAGFGAADMLGSEHNDPMVDADGHTSKNDAGGVVGGITNGEELVVRVAFKPTSSIGKSQITYNFESQKMEPLTIGGRHDSCIAIRGAVVVEAAVAIALADLKLRLRG